MQHAVLVVFFFIASLNVRKATKNSRKKGSMNMGLDMYAFSVKKENVIDTFHIKPDNKYLLPIGENILIYMVSLKICIIVKVEKLNHFLLWKR